MKSRPPTTRVIALGAAVALGMLPGAAVAAPAPSAPPSHATSGPAEVGHTGWDTYRHLDELWHLSTGVDSRQFSSFERTGGNWQDGFDGTYSCLRMEERGCVIAEASGAGEVQSIWFTRDGGDVSRTGNILVELDGQVVLDAPLQDVVNGAVGAPFVHPFVANADQTSGGVSIRVPMAYQESMRIITEHNPLFHHVSYRSFASADGIATFDPADAAADVIEASATWGHANPKPAPANPVTETADFSLAPGESVTLASLRGSGYIDEISLAIPQIIGAPATEMVSDDGRAFTGTSAFDIAIDPANEGVDLTRRFDGFSTDQRANIYVDGVLAAEWIPMATTAGQWAEQTVHIPAEFTAGKSTIRITNEFVSAGIDISEFRYFVDSIVAGEPVRTDEVDVGPWESGRASEAAHNYEITGQGWEGDRAYALPPEVTDEELAVIAASDELLTGLRLTVTFDGQTTVDAPIGEFFGSGIGEAEVHALMFMMDPEGEYTSWWAMPYARRAVVELVNTTDQNVESVASRVVSASDSSIKHALTGKYPSIGYFHATHNAGDTVDGQDWLFLDVAGHGRFLGVTHSMSGYLSEGNTRGYLEGDERFYVDGLRTPQWHGTGTEDFYEGGWYFNRGPFSLPMNGNPIAKASAYGCENNCDAAYRLLIGDAIDFSAEMVAGVEHGPYNTDPAYYSSTAFWYGHEDEVTLHQTDTVDVGNAASEAAHGYSGDGDVTWLTAVFEGDHDDVGVTADYRSTTSAVTFTVAVDRKNESVTLQRMSDQLEPYQAAEVFVDGTPVGTWLQPLHNTTQRWLDDSFDLPRSVTDGKRQLEIRLVPVEGNSAWTAASYTVLSHTNKLIGRPPGPPDPDPTVPGDRPEEVTLTPYTEETTVTAAGERFRIFDPSDGESESWYVNDHTFIQGEDGTWHLFGITGKNPADPMAEDFFVHATSPSLTDGPWTKQEPVLEADPSLGEIAVWAPHVVEHEGTYYLFYAGVTEDHTAYMMQLATSTDLYEWTRHGEALFTDGWDGRDPMVTRVGEQWVMYYTATSEPGGGNYIVAYRTSSDLVNWSERGTAYTSPVTGQYGGPTESPFVVEQGGSWYLTVCCSASYTDTRVLKSEDPFAFTGDGLVGNIAEHASEIVKDTDGAWYVSGAGWDLGGVWLRPLEFEHVEVAEGYDVAAPAYDLRLQTVPNAAILSMTVPSGGSSVDVLNGDYRTTAPFLGVGGFGPTDPAGAPAAADLEGSTLTLSGIPMGDEPVTAQWVLDFRDGWFDSSVSFDVAGPMSAPVWEMSFTLDSALATVGDDQVANRSTGDASGYPLWLESSGSGVHLVAAYLDGSAAPTDNRYYLASPEKAIVIQPVWQFFGRDIPVGSVDVGTWRIGARAGGTADELAAELHGALND